MRFARLLRQASNIIAMAMTAGFMNSNAAAKPGNPVFPGWYANPEGIIFDNTCRIYPTFSAPYDKQLHFDAFSSPDLVKWTKHENILSTKEIKWAKRAMWVPSIIRKDGKYFLFFGANNIQNDHQEGGIGIAVADKPEGPSILDLMPSIPAANSLSGAKALASSKDLNSSSNFSAGRRSSRG